MASKFLIERMEPLEKRLGVSINRIGARRMNDDDFEVNFEIRVLDGGQLRENMHVFVLLHNDLGELIGRESYFFDSDNVFAFTSGTAYFSDLSAEDVKKIVIYPERV